MYEVKDKIFLVTGGAAGIGAGVTRAFLEGGAKHVAVLDLDVASGKPLEAELSRKYGVKAVKFYKCDVTTQDLEDAFDAVCKEFGYIDCVVNAAGIMNDRPNVFVKEIEVNVTALVRSSMKAYNLMRKDHGGRGGTIINISSIAGLFQCKVLPIYSATKSAVLQFSNCLGMEPYYPRTGVRVIAICFGATDTSLLHNNKYGHIDKETDDEDAIGQTLNELPMQKYRWGDAVESDIKQLQAKTLQKIGFNGDFSIGSLDPLWIVEPKAESAVKGLVEAYKRGASASTWLITSDKPAQDVTGNVTKAYEIMSQGVFEA